MEVRVAARRLVLRHGVHEGVAGLGVLHEEPTHAHGKGAEVARGNERGDDDCANAGGGRGLDSWEKAAEKT